jgi:molybdopterin-binding protein
MNSLRGIIVSVESSQFVSLVEVSSAGDHFCAHALETPEVADYLRPGVEVELVFKENATLLGRDLSGLLSARNRGRGTVKQMKRNQLFTHVALDFKGSEVTATLTTTSCERMGLQEGVEVEWLVKTHDMGLKPIQGGCPAGGAGH